MMDWREAQRTERGLIAEAQARQAAFRFHDLRHCAITSLAENGASDSTIMAIAGHVSPRMLGEEHSLRTEAKRQALEVLSKSTDMAGYDTNDDTKQPSSMVRPS
jgi:integrase